MYFLDVMAVVTPEDTIVNQTRELCKIILEHPNFVNMQQTIQSFMDDEPARSAYENVIQLGDQLDKKQGKGEQLSQDEIDNYESARDQLLQNEVANNFLKVQREIHGVQETVSQYVAKTFELGRLPEDSDFESGSWGPSCGCH